MKILIISDTWLPQTNGVVRTLQHTRRELEALGHQVNVIEPSQFRTIPCPTYPEIRLAVGGIRKKLADMIDTFCPEAVHISTEGPLGLAARAYCQACGLPFTSAFHTKFPEYAQARFGFPAIWSYALLRRFHRASASVMVATAGLYQELQARGFNHLSHWSRGVDTELFQPREDKSFLTLPRPIFLYVGRVAVEKNIEAFLRLKLPGSQCVVGDGPQLTALKQHYPCVHFAGKKTGAELAAYFAAADVFVFPSRTDTFGLVMLEALASGLPVAAFPVTGPRDVITDARVGVLDEDLGKAAYLALRLDSATCRAHALKYSWQACTRQFAENLVPVKNQRRLKS
jgi:glycosyltransferase involved in cell wall biosynthesis